MTLPRSPMRSLLCRMLFWAVLLLLVLQAERLFLLPETAALEPPTAGLLITVFLTGLEGDAFTIAVAIALAALSALLISVFVHRFARRDRVTWEPVLFRRGMDASLALATGCLLIVLVVDVGYFGFSQQHINFVFFEYLDDLLHTSGNETGASQAAEQTAAELNDGYKWVMRIGGFLALESLAIGGWWVIFKRRIGPMLLRWEPHRRFAVPALSAAVLVSGAAGLGPLDASWPGHAAIDSEAYFNLAQNPILFAHEPLRDAFLSQWSWGPRHIPQPMTFEDAVRVTQQAVGGGAAFPFSRYPLVHKTEEHIDVRFDRPANVLLIFVEGLDRRYLGRTIEIAGQDRGAIALTAVSAETDQRVSPATSSRESIRLTPFLDRLQEDSLYFANFFSNGVATTRGLFSTFCSSYPRQGTAALKTRYERDYLCLPALLRTAGFTTEMLMSLDSDIPGVRPFMARNGLDRLYGEGDFPEDAERLGVGLTDGALFNFMRERIEALQSAERPFFLAALSSSMHDPFVIPLRHPDVRALQRHPDGYVPALRYFDSEFETFFMSLQRDGLLKNTMVIVLGDHGRHEPVGTTNVERQAGRFLVPLFMWLDDSLRVLDGYRPHHVERIASQVDLAPTILALNGLMPPVSPFVGRNLGCLFVRDCLDDNFAYLSNVYDDLIGLADQDGLWLYSFRREAFQQSDLQLKRQSWQSAVTVREVDRRYRQLFALYLVGNTLLERNQLWSWNDLEAQL
ncbi:MAG TPA: LTA synthase family protein [Nitrospira sp.]|nr:LTA synthase family protein [Nitrospira sp.]